VIVFKQQLLKGAGDNQWLLITIQQEGFLDSVKVIYEGGDKWQIKTLFD